LKTQQIRGTTRNIGFDNPTYLMHKKQKGRLKTLKDLFRRPKSHNLQTKDATYERTRT